MTKWLNEELIFPSVKAYINTLAEGLNLPPVVIIQNMVIKRLAEENAAADVYGPGGELLSEFMEQDGILLTGPELYELIYREEKDKLEKEYIANLAAVPWEALTEQDKVILSRRGIFPKEFLKGQAEIQKEQKQNIDELREKFNLPKNKPGENSYWKE